MTSVEVGEGCGNPEDSLSIALTAVSLRFPIGGMPTLRATSSYIAIMRLSYNAPVSLTFALIASVVLLIDNIMGGGLISGIFTLWPEFHFNQFGDYVRLFSSVIGHSNWTHLVGNFTFILLMGPILEEKYGSGKLLMMMMATALVTSVLHLVFVAIHLFEPVGCLGASGIVFMMVLLGSFANFKSGTIPITFILIAVLFIGKEVVDAFKPDQTSQFAHILGGIIGTVFGFVLGGKKGAGPPANGKVIGV
jgi:membrane associated rhomboid family serine protease